MTAAASARGLQPIRRRIPAMPLAALAPPAAVAAGRHVTWELDHLLNHVPDVAWVLIGALPLVRVMAAARRIGGSRARVDVALGGAAGVGAAVLFNVAVVDAGAALIWWAAVGWVLGAALVGAMARLPPQPAVRPAFGPAWRILPFAVAWIMGVIGAIPAAPRHELASSAGAQALALTLTVALALISAAIWRSEHVAPDRPWDELRETLRRLAAPASTLMLLLIGGLQAASYIGVTMDDLGHFWNTADALGRGRYPVWGDWLSLPGLPLLQLVAFTVLGYTYPAALAPLFLANVLLPWLIYRAALAAGATRPVAFAAAIAMVVLPPIQIFSLGSAEPDPVFIAWLAGAVWVFAHVLRTPQPRASLPVLGGLAAVLTVTRPEGLLYGGLLVLGALVGIRSRWAAASALVAAALLAPLALFSQVQLGRPWPTAARDFSLERIAEHAVLVAETTWPEISRDVLLEDVRFPLLISVLLALAAIGAVAGARRHWAFAVLPLAVGVNVVVTLGIDAYTVRPEYPQDFVRHIAYPTPIVAVLAALGATALGALARQRGARVHAAARAAGLLLAVYVIAGSLYMLGTPEAYWHDPRGGTPEAFLVDLGGTLLSTDIYVTAPDLWGHPLDLPRGDGLDYASFRRELFAWYAPFDLHGDSAGAAYQTLTGALAAMGMALLVAADLWPGRSRETPGPRSCRTTAAGAP